jgi:hypothetical protein
MKIATLLILVSTSLAGCVVAPLGGPPGVYVAPIAPAIVIQPYSHGYYGGPRYRHWRE